MIIIIEDNKGVVAFFVLLFQQEQDMMGVIFARKDIQRESEYGNSAL